MENTNRSAGEELAAQLLEDCGLEVETTFLQTSSMKGVGNLHRLAAESAVFVVSGSRT